jgi:hypothetical protein
MASVPGFDIIPTNKPMTTMPAPTRLKWMGIC